jgi:hypothetical protein
MLMMSPDTKDGVHPNVSRDVGRSRRAMGRTQPDHGIGIDLQNARAKTATGSLTNTHDVQHMNEGRHGGMPRELTLMSIMLAEFP